MIHVDDFAKIRLYQPNYGHIVMGIKQYIAAGEFKSKCLAVMEDVHDTGRSVIVTKRGVPVVVIIPYEEIGTAKKIFFGILKDTITINGDIISPIGEKWDADE